MASRNNRKKTNVIIFAPENWGEVTKFRHFASTTYNVTTKFNTTIAGIESHLEKYALLFNLAKRLAPGLESDKKELIDKGYTPSIKSKEFAAIVETLFSELYSSIDCLRQVIEYIYGDYSGIKTGSAGRLFLNFKNETIDEQIPSKIRISIKNAEIEWFQELRKIRNTIIHSKVGSCWLEDDGKITYYNEIFKKNFREDIISEVSIFEKKLNILLGSIFHTFNSSLKDIKINQYCGIFHGRVYERIVSPHEARDFNSGQCLSFEWFEDNKNPECPYFKKCGAYKNRKYK